MVPNPELLAAVARERQRMFLAEAERDRRARLVGRETATAYGNRRFPFRPRELAGMLAQLTGRVAGRHAPAHSRPLTHEPAS
jgi:hypothetical protein